MRPKQQETTGSGDLFRSRLDQIVNMKHELVRLAGQIDWAWIDTEIAPLYSEKGRPGIETRFVIGLLLLKHIYGLSDEGVCERWVCDPYFQYFTGEEFFQHVFPHERSDLSHWRKRLGGKLELLLAESLRVAHENGALRMSDLARVTVDTTVQPKNVTFPTDAKLLHAAILGLNRLAKKHGVALRQSYLRLAKRAAMMAGRYAHAKQFNRHKRELRFLRTRLGRLIRDIRRKIGGKADLEAAFAAPLSRAGQIRSQRQRQPAIAAETAPIPDFSGPWFRNMFNFEAPDTGQGPIINLRRLGVDAGRSVAGGDPVPLVGDYNNPILKPEAAAVVKKNGEYAASGHNFPDPSNQCGTYSPPYLFSIMLGMQMLQGKDEIVILYSQDSQVRHVRLNSQHPANLTPTPMGDAVGHYEGDALVIDTIGIKIQPYTVVDRFGTPQSEAMHVIERYRLIDATEAQATLDRHAKVVGTVGPMIADRDYKKALRIELKIEDPNVFTAPWTANVSYRRFPLPLADFNICAENNVDHLHQGDTKHVPTANRPDF